jgi:predicted phage terminase large subunit-like protein
MSSAEFAKALEWKPATIAANLEKANSYWNGTVATREKEQGKTCRGGVMQRLHRDDTAGVCKSKGYESLVFPAHFDSSRADPRDHRTKDGELLCEDRANEEYYQKKAEELGPAAAAAQLEQNPVPPGGQLIEEEYLSHRYNLLPGRLQRAYDRGRAGQGQIWRIYGDMAFKGKETSDWVVLQLWCAYLNECFLIDQIRRQIGFKKSMEMIVEFCDRHPVAQLVKLEDAANAAGLEDMLKKETPIPVVLAPIDGGCLARTQMVEGIWASGRVRLPQTAPWLGGGDGFIAEHLAFDGLNTRHDDQVAASSLALVDLAIKHKSKWDKWRKVKR